MKKKPKMIKKNIIEKKNFMKKNKNDFFIHKTNISLYIYDFQ